MHNPTTPAAIDPGPASPESDSLAVDPARAAELRRQIRALALALFAWTATGPDHSTGPERMLAMAIRPMLPRLRDALLSRLDSVDGAALEAMIGASSSALESMIYYAPGTPLPRYLWRVSAAGAELVPAGEAINAES